MVTNWRSTPDNLPYSAASLTPNIQINLHAVCGIPVDVERLRACRLCTEKNRLQADEEHDSQTWGRLETGQDVPALFN